MCVCVLCSTVRCCIASPSIDIRTWHRSLLALACVQKQQRCMLRLERFRKQWILVSTWTMCVRLHVCMCVYASLCLHVCVCVHACLHVLDSCIYFAFAFLFLNNSLFCCSYTVGPSSEGCWATPGARHWQAPVSICCESVAEEESVCCYNAIHEGQATSWGS